MLLACIAVCMSNTSFSLHGFSVHVPCQTHSFSQPSSILSTKLLFKVFKFPLWPLPLTLSAFISGLLFFVNYSLAPAYPSSSSNLVHKDFERCFLYSVPLARRLGGLHSRYLLVEEAQWGDISTQTQSNTLSFTLLSVFYNGKLAAPRTSDDSEAHSGLLTEQEQNWLM